MPTRAWRDWPTAAVLTPLPAPGVYARSNAMDVPALGPDGAPLEASVPRVLRVRGQERGVEEVHAEIDEHSRRQITGADEEAAR